MKPQRKTITARVQRKTTPRRSGNAANVREWVGRDVSEDFHARRFPVRFSLPLVLLGMVAGLALVVLRSDVIRIGYALSDAMAQERQLLEEQRRITVQVREIRAPGQLVEIARQEGFVQPERIIELDSRKLSITGRQNH